MVTLGSGDYQYQVSGENWGRLPEGWYYHDATSVDVDSGDRVYVFNRGNHPVIVFDRDGNVLRSWGHGLFTTPHGITIAPDDTVWLVDAGDSSIRRFSGEGKLLQTLAEPHRATPPLSGKPFCSPCRLAVDPRNGELLVADGYGNAKVHRFSPDGRHRSSFGESGTEPGCFNIVHDLDVDADGLIYIGDRENRRVQVFSPDGKLQARFGDLSRTAAVSVGHGRGELLYVGEYFAGGNEAYGVATGLGPRVSVLAKSGRVLARLGVEPFGAEPGRFWAPHCVAVDSRGDLYVAEVSHAEFGRMRQPPVELRSLQKLIRQG